MIRRFIPVAAIVITGAAISLGGCSNEKENEEPTIIEPTPVPTEEPADTLTPTRTAQHYESLVSVDGKFTLTPAQKASVRANSAFALDLLHRLIATNKAEKSTVFSPISLSMALAFAADGATGQTRSEIMQTLGFDDSEPNAVNELCATIMQNTLQADTATHFNIANAFYLNSLKGYTMFQDYVDRLHGYYDADIEALDFSDQASLEHINAWGSRQTNGMIPNVLQKLNPEAVAYLLNAIYMEAAWQNTFAEVCTQELPFYQESSNTYTNVPIMNQTTRLTYDETDSYQAIRMGYGSYCSPFGMTIILPRKDETTTSVLKKLTPEALDAVAQSQHRPLVNLSLPRFTTDVKTDLVNVLMAMGIREAFTTEAQFKGIVRESELFISDIFQKARIEVTEKGTKAAAITVIEMADSAGPGFGEPEQPIVFNANRPFLYFITERSTGTIYFMGTFHGTEK